MKYIVEHMESVLGEWAALEYQHICQVVGKNNLYLTSLDPSAMAMVPQQLKDEAICSPHNVLDPELGLCIEKIILLDPQATEELMPEDADKFDYLLFGGILGDHPPRDRTGELRKLGFVTRHLGPIQLPTDHAVLFSQHICEKRVPLKDVPYIDNPDIKLSKHESVEIPMRLMKGEDGKVILAPGLKAHLRKTQDDILV